MPKTFSAHERDAIKTDMQNWHIWMYIFCNIGMRFFYGAILCKAGRGGVFLTVLHHTLFNAFMMAFIVLPTNWAATLIAFVLMIAISTTVILMSSKNIKSKEDLHKA